MFYEYTLSYDINRNQKKIEKKSISICDEHIILWHEDEPIQEDEDDYQPDLRIVLRKLNITEYALKNISMEEKEEIVRSFLSMCGVPEIERDYFVSIFHKIPSRTQKDLVEESESEEEVEIPLRNNTEPQNSIPHNVLETRELSISKNKFGNFWDALSGIVLKKLDEDDWEVIGQQDIHSNFRGEMSVIPLNEEQVGMCRCWDLSIKETALPMEE